MCRGWMRNAMHDEHAARLSGVGLIDGHGSAQAAGFAPGFLLSSMLLNWAFFMMMGNVLAIWQDEKI